MKNNSKEKQEMKEIIYEESKRYFIIGFIIGIVPFIIVLLILNTSNQLSNIDELKRLVPIVGIITSFINGWSLQYRVSKKWLNEL